MKRLAFLRDKNFLPVVAVLFFAVLAGRSLIFQSGYFNMHDDLQMMRLLELEKCFKDWQIPCRWVPDLGYGFGFPLFNFYPPLPYLIGEIFRVFGFTFVDSVKFTFAISFVISGLAMYLLSKEFFGRMGGVLSAVFYIWAPYHSVDVYVRGAMNEAWALSFFPLIFYTSYKLIYVKDAEVLKYKIGLAVSYLLLFLSHNLMVMIFTPFFAVWVFLHLYLSGNWKKILPLLFSGIWSLGMAAFFTIPALVENKFTQVRTQLSGYYDYTAHFVSLKQLLISRFWGYGPSLWLEEDGMSFQVGHLHWLLSLLVLVIISIRLLKKRGGVIERLKSDQISTSTFFLLALGWVSAFMTHPRSISVYQAFPALGYVQFPWRFLTLVIFGLSFTVGFLPFMFSEWRLKKNIVAKILLLLPEIVVVLVLSVSLVVLSWNYFKPEYGKMGPLTDEQKFSGRAWDLQQTSGIYDYLPFYAKQAPNGPRKYLVEIMSGEGVIKAESNGTDWGQFNIDVLSDEAMVRINILNFPGWKVYVDGQEVEITVPEEELWGRMWVNVPNGEHVVTVNFTNTPVRTISNIISILSFGLLIVLLINMNKQRLKM